jgi:hypothetical protein
MLAPDPEMRSPGVGSARAKSQTSIITNEYVDDVVERQVIVLQRLFATSRSLARDAAQLAWGPPR